MGKDNELIEIASFNTSGRLIRIDEYDDI